MTLKQHVKIMSIPSFLPYSMSTDLQSEDRQVKLMASCDLLATLQCIDVASVNVPSFLSFMKKLAHDENTTVAVNALKATILFLRNLGSNQAIYMHQIVDFCMDAFDDSRQETSQMTTSILFQLMKQLSIDSVLTDMVRSHSQYPDRTKSNFLLFLANLINSGSIPASRLIEFSFVVTDAVSSQAATSALGTLMDLVKLKDQDTYFYLSDEIEWARPPPDQLVEVPKLVPRRHTSSTIYQRRAPSTNSYRRPQNTGFRRPQMSLANAKFTQSETFISLDMSEVSSVCSTHSVPDLPPCRIGDYEDSPVKEEDVTDDSTDLIKLPPIEEESKAVFSRTAPMKKPRKLLTAAALSPKKAKPSPIARELPTKLAQKERPFTFDGLKAKEWEDVNTSILQLTQKIDTLAPDINNQLRDVIFSLLESAASLRSILAKNALECLEKMIPHEKIIFTPIADFVASSLLNIVGSSKQFIAAIAGRCFDALMVRIPMAKASEIIFAECKRKQDKARAKIAQCIDMLVRNTNDYAPLVKPLCLLANDAGPDARKFSRSALIYIAQTGSTNELLTLAPSEADQRMLRSLLKER